MRLAENSPDRLRLIRRPWGVVLACLLLMLVFAAPTGAFLWQGRPDGAALFGGFWTLAFLSLVVFARFETAEFTRLPPMLTLRSRSLLGRRERVLPLSRIVGVTLDRRRGGWTGGAPDRVRHDTARPVLRLDDGTRLPLCRFHTRESQNERLVAAIAAWLDAEPGA